MSLNPTGTYVRKSRYANTLRFQVFDGSSLNIITGYRATTVDGTSATYIQHTILQGETMQDIALKYYGRSDLWYVVADQSPQIFYPEDISDNVGAVLRLAPKSAIVGI